MAPPGLSCAHQRFPVTAVSPRLFLLLFSTPALANEALPSPAGSLLQMLLGLGLTLALMVGGLYLLKRLQGTRKGPAGSLRILGATALGPREKVVLLNVGSQVLVLGVTPGSISTLHTLPASDLPEPAAAAPLPAAGEFAARLKQMLERRRES